ncbi:hypothetical protein TNCV_3532751 [Trichonephila clavipes]|nr:hypothetical protein TNCV_3532751 [Trichonephila clavipes]
MEITHGEQRSYIKIAVLRGKNAMEYHSELVDAFGNNALPHRTLPRHIKELVLVKSVEAHSTQVGMTRELEESVASSGVVLVF